MITKKKDSEQEEEEEVRQKKEARGADDKRLMDAGGVTPQERDFKSVWCADGQARSSTLQRRVGWGKGAEIRIHKVRDG